MYNIATLTQCLNGLIGFERPYNDLHEPIDADIAASASGVYVSGGLHPLLTYDNLWACAEQYSKITPPAYAAATVYHKGSLVSSSSKVYQSITDANTGNAVTNTANWRETTLYSAFLRRMYESSINKLFSRLAVEKKLHEVGKSLIDNVSLYEGVGNISGRITKNSRFVGLKISVKHPDTVAALNYIGLQIDTAQTVTLYLFHSSQAEPVKTFTLTHTKSVSFQWHSITAEVLAYMDSNVNAGGVYYLGYYEDDLTGQAIKKEVSFDGKSSCGSCSEAVANRNIYAKWGRYVGIQPFYVNSSDLTGTDLWDEEREFYVSDSNWGINIQMNIRCDLSTWVCQNKSILVEPLSRQLVVDFLTEMAFSMRDNQKKEKLAGLAAVALDNQENGQSGEARKLSGAIKALSFDFSNLSSPCAPCNQANTAAKRGNAWGR